MSSRTPTAKEPELTLKVMRLSKPSFQSSTTLFAQEPVNSLYSASISGQYNSAKQIAWKSLMNASKKDSQLNVAYVQETTNLTGLHDFGTGPLMSLPTSFGSIYLGETFSCYMCVNNESRGVVADIGIKAEVQTATQRFILIDSLGVSYTSPPSSANGSVSNLPSNLTNNTLPLSNSIEISSLPPVSKNLSAKSALESNTPVQPRIALNESQSSEFLLSHEIKELGTHILVCTVQYSVALEKKQFRKFFKFQVLNPLAVKTKVNSLADDKILLEAQIQNSTQGLMVLEKLLFQPSDLFQFQDLSVISKDKQSVFKDADVLEVKDTRQYLYLLTPKQPQDYIAKLTPSLGKLDIAWRTGMGQTGRLQTSQLTRKITAQQQEPFDICVTKFPPMIIAESVFSIQCKVMNHTRESVRLTLSGIKSKMGTVLLSGFSERVLGSVAPYSSTLIDLSFFPLYTGVHRISGLRLADVISGYSKDIDQLLNITVYAK